MQFETLAIHDGQAPDPFTGSVTVPVYQASTFERESLEHHGEFFYSRIGNPTRKALESTIALLENGRHGLAFASGVAATMAAPSTPALNTKRPKLWPRTGVKALLMSPTLCVMKNPAAQAPWRL